MPHLWEGVWEIEGTLIMFHNMMIKNRFLERKMTQERLRYKRDNMTYLMVTQWLSLSDGSFQRVKTLCLPCESTRL